MALANPGSKLIGEVLGLVSKLPPGTIPAVVDLVRTVKQSKDPALALRLATMAAAGKLGRHALADKLIKARK